jgi:RNA polymerase sigma-70 factor (sigma-E family)
MSTSKDPVLGGPAEQEPLGELFGAVFELAGQAASRLSPDEVDARLHRIVRKASRPVGASSSSGPCTAADPRSVTLDGHHPDRQDTVQAGSVLAFPRKSTRDSPAGPELRPASAPPTSSPDVPVHPAAAFLPPEPSSATGDTDSAAPNRPLVAAASQARPHASGAGAPGYPTFPVALLAGGGTLAVAVADVALEPVRADWDADRAVAALYSTHYRSLVRLATLLVHDVATAEEVVQDSFVAMHGGWRRLRDSEKALTYLRQSVVSRARSVSRHGVAVDRHAPKPPPDMPSAEHGAITLVERSAVVTALRKLPPRQREALVLRYYQDLSEAQIADAMGISKGAVKSHTAKAMAALRIALEQEA